MPVPTVVFDPPRNNLLAGLLDLAIEKKATDIHIRQRDVCLFRIGGKLTPLMGPDDPYQVLDGDFASIVTGLNLVKSESKSFVHTHSTHQVRGLYVTKTYESGENLHETIILRIQPKDPPALEGIITKAESLAYLLNAQGLVLVIGSIGSGKTTFAAALSKAWASQGRHIVTLEDPVEYKLSDSILPGQVTQFPCSILHLPSDKGMTFEAAVYLSLRCDTDGLFIGECREPDTFKRALDFSTAFEPCVTTLHAGGASDAIIKGISMAQHYLDLESAKLMLIQGLHSIVHVSLAFKEDGTPIPLIVVIPFKTEREGRAILTKLDPSSLDDALAEYLHKDIPEAITYHEAKEIALAAGATAESIHSAIGRQLKGPSYLSH